MTDRPSGTSSDSNAGAEGQEIPIHKSTLPEAQRLSDLESLAHDLSVTAEMIRKLIEGQSDPILLQALFAAALIAYRRCFTSGIREALVNADVTSSPNNAGWLHDHLRAQADKLIAHSVNPFEHTQSGFLVRDNKIIGVASLSAKLVNFDVLVLKQWGRLVMEILETILRPRIEAAKSELLRAGKELPIAQITRGEILQKNPFTPQAMAKRRPNSC